MSDALYTRLQALLGPGGVERDAKGLPRAVPESDDALAMVCALASEEGWKLRLEGAGTWLPADAPADLSLSTRSLNRLIALNPADLVATVQPGMPIEALQSDLFARACGSPWILPGDPSAPSDPSSRPEPPDRCGMDSARCEIMCWVVPRLPETDAWSAREDGS